MKGATKVGLVVNAVLGVTFEVVAASVLLNGAPSWYRFLDQLWWTMPLVGAMGYGIAILWNLVENVLNLRSSVANLLDDEDGWFSRCPAVFCVALCAFTMWFEPGAAAMLKVAVPWMGCVFLLFTGTSKQREVVTQAVEESDTLTEIIGEPTFAM